MNEHNRDSIGKAYQSFNSRNIPVVLSLMHAQVQWPQAWKGTYVTGHEQLKNYWTKQWQEINPTVKPLSLSENAKGQIEVMVHQTVKDLEGKIVIDDIVRHVYTFENGLIKHMEIQKP